MKKSLITMMAALMGVAYAGETTVTPVTTTQDFKRLSGAVHVGGGTAYTCHGYVPTTAVVQGEGYGMGAIQLGYDFGKEGAWSYTGALSYKAPFSGHTLYGAPTAVSRETFAAVFPNASSMTPEVFEATYQAAKDKIHPMPQKNIENEFIVRNGLKYTRNLWNVSFGHDYIHGGIAGVVAKHFDGQKDSKMQQVWTNFEVTPVAWFSADLNCARTFDTVQGWWFEAHARLKAPIIGSPEDIKVAGILEYGMSWAANFYDSKHNACSNGTQAFWLKLSTPWFVNEAKNFILTPAVSFNWLGKGGMKANEKSEAKAYGSDYVPFRNFAVVGD
ncbi:MAG: hypothetical protein IKY91_00300, partial [Akkermansia sp.]|nr:hypothetical protein [Akkermansia sp.]